MPERSVEDASTTEGLPISPSMGPTLQRAEVPSHWTLFDGRSLAIAAAAVGLGTVACLAAVALLRLIAFFTNLSFYGRFSFEEIGPPGHRLGWGVVFIPVVGGLIVGIMARFGSKGIRGHGIPEAMEQVLTNESRIPARLTWLKPVSAAVSIGTGGPFGAEGPIIATGGAMGSLVGQLVRTSAAERRTLLAAGAAAGMAATFGSPLSAVLLAIELLLFEFRARSLVAVGLASVTAASLRHLWNLDMPVFPMPDLAEPAASAMAVYVAIGALSGVAAVVVTRAVYAVEDAFERLPIHWMWWPALGAIAVGVVGYFEPRTLGVGYENITDTLAGRLALGTVASLCALKFVSWSIALGSGTSGGTLAPLLTIGGGFGALLGAAAGAGGPARASIPMPPHW